MERGASKTSQTRFLPTLSSTRIDSGVFMRRLLAPVTELCPCVAEPVRDPDRVIESLFSSCDDDGGGRPVSDEPPLIFVPEPWTAAACAAPSGPTESDCPLESPPCKREASIDLVSNRHLGRTYRTTSPMTATLRVQIPMRPGWLHREPR